MGQAARLNRKRQEILEAAAAVFREEGYEAASMDRIAERAGASKRTVYNHFGGKEALFGAVIEQQLEAIMALKRVAWDPARTLEAQLADFARAKTAVMEDPEWLGLLRVVLGVFIRDPATAEETMCRVGDGERHLERWLTQAHEAGRLRVPDVEEAAEIFWGMISGVLFWPWVFSAEAPDPRKLERLRGEVIGAFLARYGIEP